MAHVWKVSYAPARLFPAQGPDIVHALGKLTGRLPKTVLEAALFEDRLIARPEELRRKDLTDAVALLQVPLESDGEPIIPGVSLLYDPGRITPKDFFAEFPAAPDVPLAVRGAFPGAGWRIEEIVRSHLHGLAIAALKCPTCSEEEDEAVRAELIRFFVGADPGEGFALLKLHLEKMRPPLPPLRRKAPAQPIIVAR